MWIFSGRGKRTGVSWEFGARGKRQFCAPPPPQPRWRRMFSELVGGGGGGHSGAKLFHQFAEFVISFVQGRPGR